MVLGALIKKIFIKKQEVRGSLSRLGLETPLNKIEFICNFNTHKQSKYID